MAPIVFTLIDGTSLYELSGDAGLLWFSLATPTGKSIDLNAAWGAAGCFLVLNEPLAPTDYQNFERAVRAKLGTPVAEPRNFAWVGWDGAAPSPFLQMSISGGAAALVMADVVLSAAGIPPVGVAAGTPFVPVADRDGNIQSFSIQYPSQPAHDGQPASAAPWGPGLAIPMAGATAGCLNFRSLLNDPPVTTGNPVRKQLFNVRFDPVRPYDPTRNGLFPTGQIFSLAQSSAGTFALTPAV